MPRAYSKSRRDANEAELVEIWRAAGAFWIPMAPEAGFDGILVFRGIAHIVEIKDASQTNGRYHLTAAERRICQEIESRGKPYQIVTSVKQAMDLVEAE